jgi:hypothetical protein
MTSSPAPRSLPPAPSSWLSHLESALQALENFDAAAPTPAALTRLNRTAAELASLTQQFGLLGAAERNALKSRLPALLGRLGTATARLDQAKNQTATQLQNLRSQTTALTAYATVPSGNAKR